MKESGLFELIKSLNKTEKRYFKKYVGQNQHKNKNSHAVQLFDALEESEKYGTANFHRANHLKPFYKNLASEKQHLLKVLLQSINEYHRNNNIKAIIHFHLDSFELLFQKRQYKLCEKQLTKALKMAKENEYTLYLLEIYKAFGKLYQHSGNYKKIPDVISKIKSEENEMFLCVENEFKLKMIEYNFFYTSRVIGYPRTKKDKQAYEQLMVSAKPLLRKKPSLSETLSMLTIKNFFSDTLLDKKPLMQIREEWIHTAEKNEKYIRENSMQYLVSLNNLANSYDELGMRTQLEKTLKKINTHAGKNLDEEVRTFIYYYNLKLLGYINSGKFAECVTHFPKAEKGLNKFGRWFHPEYKLSFRYLFSYGYFGAKKYKEALKWTNEIILNYPSETLEEYYNFARIFILLIYFELNHDGLLDFELRSAKRYFNKREKLFAFEKVVIDFMRNSIKPEGIITTRKDFVQLRDKISLLKKNPYEQQLFNLFDWEAWANSKVKAISFEKSMQEKSTHAKEM